MPRPLALQAPPKFAAQAIGSKASAALPALTPGTNQQPSPIDRATIANTRPCRTSLVAIRSLIFTADRSLADLSRQSGLSPVVVGRIANCIRHRRLESFFSTLGRLGLGVIARSLACPEWRVLSLPRDDRCLPDGDYLCDLVSSATKRMRSIAILMSTAHVGRSAAIRLRDGKLPPIANAVLKLLAAVDGEVVIFGGDGASRRLQLPSVSKSPQRRRSPPRTQSREKSTTGRRGRLTIAKGDILAMHLDLRMTCADIASIAGISAERVRQILKLFAIEPAYRRQRRLRIDRFRRMGDDASDG